MKMKHGRAYAALLVMGASVMCMAASGGCGTPLHKAEISAGAIAASLHTAATTNHANTLETDDERKTVAQFILGAAAANDNFIGVLKASETSGKAPDLVEIESSFKALVAAVSALNSEGVLHLKSPAAQANFALIVASIQANLATIESMYPTLHSGLPPRDHRRDPVGLPPLFAIALTGTEIEELIALAIAAGSSLVPKLLSLRGKTGVQLIADAEADDEAAEEIARADAGLAPAKPVAE